MQNKITLLVTIGLSTLFVGVGCKSYSANTDDLVSFWKQGKIAEAAEEATKQVAKERKSKSVGVYLLEKGMVCRFNGQYKKSNEAFEKALKELEKNEGANVGSEALAAVSNLRALPYNGYSYDRILANIYIALNHMSLGDQDGARTALIKAGVMQKQAENLNKKRIEKAEQAERDADSDKSNSLSPIKGSDEFAKGRKEFESHKAYLPKSKHYANYRNPFAELLQSLYVFRNATHPSDLDMAKQTLEFVQGMVGEQNPFVKEELRLVDSIALNKPLKDQFTDTVYVIFESSSAPSRDEVKIRLPLGLVTDKTPSQVAFAFPKLVFSKDPAVQLSVTSDSGTVQTIEFADMNKIVAQEFDNEMPAVIAKTLLATVIKAYLTKVGSNAVFGEEESIFKSLSEAIVQELLMGADTRTWRTLPRSFQVCIVPRPKDGILKLALPGNGTQELNLGEGQIMAVHVRHFGPGTPLKILQFPFRSEPKKVELSTE